MMSKAGKRQEERCFNDTEEPAGMAGNGAVGVSSWLSMYSSLSGGMGVKGAVCFDKKKYSGELVGGTL
jgi:hypothetical protein